MSINTTITESPVILFLGAGASVPLVKPVMKDFVARLAEQITPIMTDPEIFISLDR